MSTGKINRNELVSQLAATLDITRFRDYCPNGLQVEGRQEIGHIVTGVTASLALLEAARESGADAILVHHGYFWRGEDPRIAGPMHKKLKLLLEENINLFAYHLPLDAHPQLGNNAQFGKRLGLVAHGRFGEQDLGWVGTSADAVDTLAELAARAERALGRKPLMIGEPEQKINSIAWCTGAAQSAFPEAIAAGASVYLSGEISEQTVHLARETGVAYLACGHHASERYGIEALGAYLAHTYGLTHQFIDMHNPV